MPGNTRVRVLAKSEVEIATTSTAAGWMPANFSASRTDSYGNSTSSFFLVNRSSLAAKTIWPSFSKAAPESCPSQIPSTYMVLSPIRWTFGGLLMWAKNARSKSVRRQADVLGPQEARAISLLSDLAQPRGRDRGKIDDEFRL